MFIRQQKKYISWCCLFFWVLITPWIALPGSVYAQSTDHPLAKESLTLPEPGTPVSLTANYKPAIIMGINIYRNNPLKIDFILDQGNLSLEGDTFKHEADRLIRYFLTSLTIPEKEMWVNLSPYEKNRIIPKTFGLTTMGCDLLAQDYLLKQLSSSLMNPEDRLGEKFWERIYSQSLERFGTIDLPLNVFNKIWVVPDKALIHEHADGAFIISSHLKVMLEEDYLALEANQDRNDHGLGAVAKQDLDQLNVFTKQIVRHVLLPEIEREVNEGQTFANLRQIYHSMLLATWYKKALKESLLGQIYIDQKKTKGISSAQPEMPQEIYDRYLEAFQKGVYDFIREEYDPVQQTVIPRKYFSGGVTLENVDFDNALLATQETLAQMQLNAVTVTSEIRTLGVDIDAAMLNEENVVRPDRYEQRIIRDFGLTHVDRHAFEQVLLIEGVPQARVAAVADAIWEDLNQDLQGQPTRSSLLRKYQTRFNQFQISKNSILAILRRMLQRNQPLEVPVISLFEYHWGEASAKGTLEKLRAALQTVQEERSITQPKITWVIEDVGMGFGDLDLIMRRSNMNIISFFQNILSRVITSEQTPYMDEATLKRLALQDTEINAALGLIHTTFQNMKLQRAGPLDLEGIISNLRRVTQNNQAQGIVDEDLTYQLALYEGLKELPVTLLSELNGMDFYTFFNHLWADFLRNEAQHAFLTNDQTRFFQLTRWHGEIHARSNVIDRDLGAFVPYLRQLNDQLKSDPSAVLAFPRGPEHVSLQQILYENPERISLDEPENTTFYAQEWLKGVEIETIEPQALTRIPVLQVLHNLAEQNAGLTHQQFLDRGLGQIDLTPENIQALAEYTAQYISTFQTYGNIITPFNWLMRDQKANQQNLILGPQWDKFVREHLAQLRRIQYLESWQVLYNQARSMFPENQEMSLAMYIYYLASLGEGLEPADKEAFFIVALEQVVGEQATGFLQGTGQVLLSSDMQPSSMPIGEWLQRYAQSYVPAEAEFGQPEIMMVTELYTALTESFPSFLPVAPRTDRAMLSDEVGGIDLNPAMVEMEIKKEGTGLKLLPLSIPADKALRLQGAVPVITQITPVTNLPLMLGLGQGN